MNSTGSYRNSRFFFKKTNLSKVLSFKFVRFGTKINPAVLNSRSHAADDGSALLNSLINMKENQKLGNTHHFISLLARKVLHLQEYLFNSWETMEIFQGTSDSDTVVKVAFNFTHIGRGPLLQSFQESIPLRFLSLRRRKITAASFVVAALSPTE
jgi:hypothetical protein